MCKLPHVPSSFREKDGIMVRGKEGTLGSPRLLSQLCKLFRNGFFSAEINETVVNFPGNTIKYLISLCLPTLSCKISSTLAQPVQQSP